MDDPYFVHQPNTEPIPGYRLLQPLGRGGFGEVWECEAPGGLHKAIKFVQGGLPGLNATPIEEELRAVERVKSIRHPFLLSMERVERVGEELVIVLELADRNLAEVLQAEQKVGRPGIRETLLNYLREAAEALDVMNNRYDLQHLDIKPQNLFLLAGHVKVGDFGLTSSLGAAATGPARVPPGAITPLYASPEVFEGSLSRHSDQYSLAIVYQELLTGSLPYSGKNVRQLLIQHLKGDPNLQALPEADQVAVARALSKAPDQRFPSCSDFIHALTAGQTEVISGTIPAASSLRPPAPVAAPASASALRDTHKTRPRPARTHLRPGKSPLPDDLVGLEAQELLSRTPLSEVWRARVRTDGSSRLVKVLYGLPAQNEEAIDRLEELRHPALVPVEVLFHRPGRLVLLSPDPGDSLRELLEETRARGDSGVSRPCLLGYLRSAAEALHVLAARHGLFHWLLNPRCLYPRGHEILLGDFGLAQLLWRPAGQSIVQLNSRYAAPELATGEHLGAATDQYSLALLYHELLTGGTPALNPARAGKPAGFCLDRIPETERAVLLRALDPDPGRRFESAVALVVALESATVPTGDTLPARKAASTDTHVDVLGITQGVTALAPAQPDEDVLQTRFGTALDAEVVQQRLQGFRQQWQANLVSAADGQFLLRMQTPRSFWQRWIGRQPGLDIHIELQAAEAPPAGTTQRRTEVGVQIRPHDCTRDQSRDLLKVVGPLLVESVRTHLHVQPRGRSEERLTWHHPLQLCSIGRDGSTGAPVECQGKDISLNGIGFYLPGQLPSSHVELHLPPTPQTPQVAVRARVVRIQNCGDGWYEVGAVLQTPREPAGEGVPATAACP